MLRLISAQTIQNQQFRRKGKRATKEDRSRLDLVRERSRMYWEEFELTSYMLTGKRFSDLTKSENRKVREEIERNVNRRVLDESK